MCYLLYIGSHSQIPLISPENWDKTETTTKNWMSFVKPLWIKELTTEEEKLVQNKFKEPFVYYAGSYDDCGYGYQHCLINDDDFENDPEEIEASLRSRHALYDHVIEYQPCMVVGMEMKGMNAKANYTYYLKHYWTELLFIPRKLDSTSNSMVKP